MAKNTDYKAEQLATKQALKPKYFAKGESIEYITREGKKSFYPNSKGQNAHLVGKKLQFFNRKENRRKLVDRTMTKRGYMNGIHVDSFEYAIIHAIARRQGWEGEPPVSSYSPKPKEPINKSTKSRMHRERQRSFARAGA